MTSELAGKFFPDGVLKAMKPAVAGGNSTVAVGEETDEGTVKLDAAKKKAMDVEGTNGPNKGKPFLAIYEIKDDTLRVCYDPGGKARPAESKTGAVTQRVLVEYRRKK
jgi:uncharacterized protein (TIGR03067 family)